MHLPPDIQTKLEERLAQLPKALRELIQSDALPQKIRAISSKHGLNLWQGQILENEISLALIGLEDREGFTDVIKNQLEVEEEEAQAITKDVDIEIFTNIRTALQNKEEESSITQEEAESDPEEMSDKPETQSAPAPFLAKDNGREVDPLETTSREASTAIDLSNKPEQKKRYRTDPYREPIE